MPLPVIADIYRIAIEWGPPYHAVNVLNVKSTGSPSEHDVAATLDTANAGTSHNLYEFGPSGVGVTKFSVTKLDGVSGAVDFVPAHWPTGGGGSDCIPNMAACLSLKTGLRGPSHRGRLFVGPVAESTQTSGVLSPTGVANMLAAWQYLFDQIELGTPSLLPGVASYKHATWSPLTSISIDPVATTQRRRLSRLRT